MDPMLLRRALALAVVLGSATGCSDGAPAAASDGDDSGALESSAAPDAARRDPAGLSSGRRGDRIFEIRQALGGDGAPIASNNYLCTICVTDTAAEAAFDAATAPDGFEITPPRRLVAARSTLFDPVNSRGAPEALDLIAAIDGDESHLAAQPQFGDIIDGAGVLVTMESSRRLEWDAGESLEEISDGEHTYVLFAEVDAADATPPDRIELPPGWSHQRRELDAPFVLDPVPRVMVFLALEAQHLWQRVQPPE